MTVQPPVSRTTVVRCSPERAFDAFTGQIGAWWPLGSHSVFGSESAGVGLDGGRIVERSADGRTSVWGEVVAWQPPSLLAFTWRPGRAASEHTQVTITFAPEGSGTRVLLEHVGWEVFGDRAGAHRASYDSPDGWTMVVGRFAEHAGATSAA